MIRDKVMDSSLRHSSPTAWPAARVFLPFNCLLLMDFHECLIWILTAFLTLRLLNYIQIIFHLNYRPYSYNTNNAISETQVYINLFYLSKIQNFLKLLQIN